MANSVSHLRHLSRRGHRTSIAWSRLAFTLCAIVAFAVQACVLQAHIHLAQAPVLAVNLASHTDQPVPGGREDGDGCPLCQAFAIAGTFVAPSAVFFHVPVLQILAAWIPVEPSLDGRTAQFHWQSRAPPAQV